MAAPHVTGLATLILAHHPDFKGTYRVRNAQRVDRLFQILKQSAQSLNLGNPHRTGAGLPDALVALNVVPVAAISPSAEIMQRLVELLQSGAVPQGNGGAAVGAGMALPQLRAVLERAGLLPGGGTGVAPQSSAPGSSVGGATAPLPQLRAVLERAGLL